MVQPFTTPPLLGYDLNLSPFTDKEGSSFSQSRSSSVSSLDNVCKESIQTLVFTEAYSRKSGWHTDTNYINI